MKKLCTALVLAIPLGALGLQFQAAETMLWYDSITVVNWDELLVSAMPPSAFSSKYTDRTALIINIVALVIALIFVWLAKFEERKEGVRKLMSALVLTVPLVVLGIQFQGARAIRWHDSSLVANDPYQRTSLYYTNKVALAINIGALIIAIVACVWSARKKQEA